MKWDILSSVPPCHPSEELERHLWVEFTTSEATRPRGLGMPARRTSEIQIRTMHSIKIQIRIAKARTNLKITIGQG